MTWGWEALFLLQDMGACPADGAGSAPGWSSTSGKDKPLLLLPQPGLCSNLCLI